MYIIRDIDDEKTFKDTHKYRRQAKTRLPQQDVSQGRQESFETQASKRQKKTFSLMLQRTALILLGVYQNYIRRILPSSCRFVPSCSEYTKEAILKFGFFRGTIKGAKRLLRCHPFSGKSGYDPLI